jgi:hypothetical protein
VGEIFGKSLVNFLCRYSDFTPVRHLCVAYSLHDDELHFFITSLLHFITRQLHIRNTRPQIILHSSHLPLKVYMHALIDIMCGISHNQRYLTNRVSYPVRIKAGPSKKMGLAGYLRASSTTSEVQICYYDAESRQAGRNEQTQGKLILLTW